MLTIIEMRPSGTEAISLGARSSPFLPLSGSSIVSEQRGVISGVDPERRLRSLCCPFSFSRCPFLNRPRRFRRIPLAHAACVEPQSCVMLIMPTELHRGSIPTVSPDKISRILAAAAPLPLVLPVIKVYPYRAHPRATHGRLFVNPLLPPFPLLLLPSRDKLRGGDVSPNPCGLVSRNANRSIKLGDILIEVARSGDSGAAFVSGSEWRKKCYVPRVLIRAVTCVFLVPSDVIGRSLKRSEG